MCSKIMLDIRSLLFLLCYKDKDGAERALTKTDLLEIHFLPDSIRLADPFSPLTFPSVLAFSSPLFTLSVMDTYYLLTMHSPI